MKSSEGRMSSKFPFAASPLVPLGKYFKCLSGLIFMSESIMQPIGVGQGIWKL